MSAKPLISQNAYLVWQPVSMLLVEATPVDIQTLGHRRNILCSRSHRRYCADSYAII